MIEYIKQLLVLLAIAPENAEVQLKLYQAIASMLHSHNTTNTTYNDVVWLDISTTGTTSIWTTVGRTGVVGSWSFSDITNNPMIIIEALRQLSADSQLLLTLSFDGSVQRYSPAPVTI